MVKAFSILLVFCGFQSHAIEYQFDGGQVTALGGITTQPAALGYLNEKFSFAASATSLEYTHYQMPNNSFEKDSSPFRMTPIYIGSAMSTSYGGWSVLVFSDETEYKTFDQLAQGGVTTQSNLAVNEESFSGHLSSGLRLHENWSLGWSLALQQAQTEKKTETVILDGINSTFISQEITTQNTLGLAKMGFIFNTDSLVVGFTGALPPVEIGQRGKKRKRQLSSPGGILTDDLIETQADIRDVWSFEAGIRFGLKGIAYILSDQYSTDGQHVLKTGFEYIGSWGSIASGLLYSNHRDRKLSQLTAGFVKDHGNFKWGIGPYFLEIQNKIAGNPSAKTLGVLYSSEIRY